LRSAVVVKGVWMKLEDAERKGLHVWERRRIPRIPVSHS